MQTTLTTRAFYLVTAIAIIAIVGVYVPSITFGVAHDDLIAYQSPIVAGDWSWALAEFQTHGLWMPAIYFDLILTTKLFGAGVFRPDYSDALLYGVKPLVLHAGNIIQHTISAILLMLVAMRLTGKRSVAVLAGLLWFAHPIQIDTVAIVAERKNTLSTLIMLSSLLAYQAYSASRQFRTLALCFGLFVLAAMAKTTTVMLPIMFLVLDAYRVDFDFRKLSIRNVLEKIPFFAVSFAVGVINLVAETLAAPRTPGSIELGMANLATYIGHVLWPVGLTQFAAEYGPELPYLAIAGVAGFVAILLAAWYLRHRNPVATFGLLWFLVFLVPALDISFVVGISSSYGHNLTIPIIGLAIAAASCIKPVAGFALAALFAVLISQQIHRWDHYNEAEFMAAFSTHAEGKLQICRREHEKDVEAALSCLSGVKTAYVWQRKRAVEFSLALLPPADSRRDALQSRLAQIESEIEQTNNARWWMRLYALAGRPVGTHNYPITKS